MSLREKWALATIKSANTEKELDEIISNYDGHGSLLKAANERSKELQRAREANSDSDNAGHS